MDKLREIYKNILHISRVGSVVSVLEGLPPTERTQKIVEYNKRLETGEELIPQPFLAKNNWPSIPAVDFSDIPSYLDKLEDLGVIKYAKNPISGMRWIDDSKTGKKIRTECILLTFIQYVDSETIKDIKSEPLAVSFNGQLCSLMYGKKIIHKPRRAGCSGKLLQELWTNRKGPKHGGMLQSVKELCNKTGYKNKGSLHNEITKIEKKIKKANAPIKIEQQNGYMMVIE